MISSFRTLAILLMALILSIGTLVCAWAEEGSLPAASYSKADLDDTYDAAVPVDLGVQASPYRVTSGGTYILTGTLKGQILIEAGGKDKVQLVLSNADISSVNGPAIYVHKADKIILTLAPGSVNSIKDGLDYALDAEGANAAIYSKADLTINGTGALLVNGQTAHGIVSRDDLTIISGNLTVNSVKDALRGKDSVTIRDGEFTLTAGSDGIVSADTKADKGYIILEGGYYTIKAQRDAIQAESSLQIMSGTYNILAGAERDGAVLSQNADARDQSGWQELPSSGIEIGSTKGLKSKTALVIKGGDFSLNTQDDAIHSGGTLEIFAGTFTIESGDDAIHADKSLVIHDGQITVIYSYEGLESREVTINGGIIDIYAVSDGINAADSVKVSDHDVQQGVLVTINGGTIKVTAVLDAIDSNGDIVINGGDITLTILQLGRSNKALDASGQVFYNGGTLVIND
jgi:hypothetical protein